MYAYMNASIYAHVCMYVCICHGNKCVPDCNRVLVFGGETLHYSITMMSLCCIINDVMDLPQNY